MRVAKLGVNRMPLIGRAWKANVNVWKRHLTLQSVFNRGECMMHVDKNANGHVVDQNVDRISRKIAYLLLSGRIRSKGSSCMRLFFFFFWKKKNEYKTCLPVVTTNEDFSRDLEFGHASQRSDGFEVWTYFLEVWRIFGRWYLCQCIWVLYPSSCKINIFN